MTTVEHVVLLAEPVVHALARRFVGANDLAGRLPRFCLQVVADDVVVDRGVMLAQSPALECEPVRGVA